MIVMKDSKTQFTTINPKFFIFAIFETSTIIDVCLLKIKTFLRNLIYL